MLFNQLSIRSKLGVILAISILGTIGVVVTLVLEERRILLEERRGNTQHLVEVAYGVLTHFGELAQKGAMSEADARRAAAHVVRSLQRGENKLFWIQDLEHRIVVDPIQPENEATNKAGLQDASGKFVVQETVNLARERGAGFVEASWSRSGSSEPVAKISYFKLYRPWGWIIGSGRFVDDIDTVLAASVGRIGIAVTTAALLLGGLMLIVMRGIARPLEALRIFGDAMRHISRDGDLSKRIPIKGSDEISLVMRDFNTLMDGFQSGLKGVMAHLNDVTSSSRHLLDKSNVIRDGSAAQSAEAAAAAVVVEQLTTNITLISGDTKEAEAVLARAGDCASGGERSISIVTDGMQRLAQSVHDSATIIETLGSRSQEITGIVRVIKDIADQTNLLALNAAIEAARAGEQGRGFAVVADEVRKLAERAASATTEISTVIGAIQEDTARAVEAMHAGSATAQEGVAQVQAAAHSMTEIAESTQRILQLTSRIASSIRQQTEAGRDMARRADDIAAKAEENSDASRDAHSVASKLEASARELAESVAHFRVA
jgi:methyl-accepting chemotaxis protein